MSRLAVLVVVTFVGAPAVAGDPVWLSFSGQFRNQSGKMTFEPKWRPSGGLESRLRELERATLLSAPGGRGVELRLTANDGRQIHHQGSILGASPVDDVAGTSIEVPKRGGALVPLTVRSGADIVTIDVLVDGKRVWRMTRPKAGPRVTSLTARVELENAVFRWKTEPKTIRAHVSCEIEPSQMRPLLGDAQDDRLTVPVFNIKTTRKNLPCRVLFSDGFHAVTRSVTLKFAEAPVEAQEFSEEEAFTIPVGGGGGGGGGARTGKRGSGKGSSVTAEQRTALDRCVQRAQMKDPDVGGRLTVRLWVGSSGHVQRINVVSSAARLKPALGCLLSSMKRWKYPRRPNKERRINHTFVF